MVVTMVVDGLCLDEQILTFDAMLCLERMQGFTNQVFTG